MRYKMVSEYGNAVHFADNEREKEHFERLGYREEKQKTAKSNNTSVKRGKNNVKVEN